MRLLMVNKFYDLRGGAERVLFDLESGMRERGHEVAVFATLDERNRPTPWRRYFAPNRDYDAPTWREKLRYARATIYDREARECLARLLDDFDADVAHLHNVYHQLSPSVLDELRERGIPVVLTLHDYKLACPVYRLFRDGEPCTACVSTKLPLHCGLHRCSRGSAAESWLLSLESTVHRWRRSWTRNVDLFVSPSRFLADMVARAGVDAARIRVIPNAPRELAAAAGSGCAARPRVLFAGRLSAEKGVDLLVEAARRHPEVELHIAGTGPEEARLRERAAGLAHVRWLGHLDAAALREEYAAAWAVAVPSRWYENAPLSVLEAQAAGRAVIAAAHGGLLEMVEDGVDGWLVPPADPGAWANAIGRVATHAAELASMGERAGARARRDADFSRFLDRHESLYREVERARGERR